MAAGRSRRPVRPCWWKQPAKRTLTGDILGPCPWRKPQAVHVPGKVLLDVTPALGGDGLADVALLRSKPAVFGPIASDPTVSRLIDTLATAGGKVLAAIDGGHDKLPIGGHLPPHTDGHGIPRVRPVFSPLAPTGPARRRSSG